MLWSSGICVAGCGKQSQKTRDTFLSLMHGVRVHGEVIPETVGQFTGLTDKNGTKIFEGDVVKRCFTLTRGPNKESRETQVGVVWYDNVTCGYLIRGACNLRRQWPGDTIEVIGNIHDNPELMEGERHG